MRLTYIDMYLSKEYHIKTDKIRCSQKLLLEAQKPNSWGETQTKRGTIILFILTQNLFVGIIDREACSKLE